MICRLTGAIGGAALMLLAVGCTQTTTGSPVGATSAPTPTSSTGQQTTSTPLPSSTAPAVALAQVDPCTLVEANQIAALGFETAGRSSRDSTTLQCLFRSNTAAFAAVSTDVTSGYDSYAQPAPDKTINAQTIGRFPAISVFSTFTPTVCLAVVDVGDGQALIALSNNRDNASDRNCSIATELATTAVTKLG